jgi:hypothetical protein
MHPVKTSNLGVLRPGKLVKNYAATAIKRVWLATMVPRLDRNFFLTATIFFVGQNHPS